MKRILLLLCTCCSISISFAQSGLPSRVRPAFSIGGELGVVQRGLYNVGYGFSGKIELPVTSAIGISLTGGYNWLHYRSISFGNLRSAGGTEAYVPLKAGARYYLAPRFYTEGELGAVLEQQNNREKLFVYALGTGFVVPFNESKNGIDIGFRYESWSKNRLQQLAFRVAYRLGW